MSIFVNGDFKIQNSWDRKPASKQSQRSRKRSVSREKSSLMNAGRQVLEQIPDILDTQMANRVYKEFQAEIPPPSSCRSEKRIPGSRDSNSRNKLPPRQKTNINASDDLVTSMASRLKQVEENSQNLKKQLKQKNGTIQNLRKQNIFLKGFRENSEDAYKKFDNLEQKNKELQKKVSQMEDYLKKYGLKWVGNGKIDGNLDHGKMKKDIANSKHNYRLPSEIGFDTIQRRVEELNAGLHSEGQGTEIYSDNGIHKFRKAEPLAIAFFGDGIAIKGFNFYPYKSKESLKVLSDLVDGYFPYVLKGKYPNGVFLKVVDMIAKKYNDQQNQGNLHSMESVAQKEFLPPSKQQFLDKLPKQVIKNGKIIPIRGAIQKRLNGITQQVQQHFEQFGVQKDGCFVFRTQIHSKLENEQVNIQDICTLKIRTQEGKICILQLSPTSQIKQIYRWMQKMIKEKFNLMGNYPRREYSEKQTQNLEQLGLTPNAILHIQKIK